MAVEYYDMRHEGAQIDDAVDLVLSGDIIKNNTSNTVTEGEELPVSGDAVFNAIEANRGTLNAKISELHEAVGDKVDKEDGERLITEEEVEKFNDKAEKEGVYPNFVSGWSSNLTGRGDATERMFFYAPTGGDLSIGDGVAKIKAIKGNSIVEDGSIKSLNVSALKTTGFNQWDEEWEKGTIDSVSGDKLDNPTYADGKIRSTNYIEVLPNTQYYCGKSSFMYWEYDNEYNYIPTSNLSGLTPTNGLFTTRSNCKYIRFRVIDATYHNDICINLSHTGYRNGEYEPYEEHTLRLGELSKYMPLRSAGASYDEINKNAKVTRIGIVDLGELSWGISADGTLLYSTHWGVEINGKTGINVLCDKYEAYSWTSATVKDKTISIQVGYTSSGKTSVMVRDSAYTDPTAFKKAMKGVMLYYELAEPNEEVFAEAINLNYLANDFGTEEAIVTVDSAPFRADIIYQFNAQDRIRKNTADIKAMDGKYLAATPSGNPNHNLYISLGAVWSDAGWQLNGVPLTNEEIDVSYLGSLPYLHRIEPSAWGNPSVMFQQKFKTNFYAIGQVPYYSTRKVLDGNSIGYASHALEVVRFQSSINQTTYKTFVKNCSYMFGDCPKLREIKDYLDVSQSTTFYAAFGSRTTSLETIWLIGLKASIDFSGTPVLKKECLLYMIQKAAPTTAITIKVHADVYAWSSTDTDIQNAITAQQSLITLIA